MYFNLILVYNKSSFETKVITMLKLTAIAGAVLSIALVGCGGGGGGGSPATASTSAPLVVTLKSGTASGVVSTNAMYTFTNQQWQAFTHSAVDNFSQYVDGIATQESASDTITWNSGTPDDTVLSYPSVVYGSVPGYNNPTPSHLPAAVTALPTLRVNGSVSTNCADTVVHGISYPCKYDTAFDMYLTDTKGEKSGEIMIWTESAGQPVNTASPDYFGQHNIGGNFYHVLNRMITITNYDAQNNPVVFHWKYLAFVATSPIRTFTDFDIGQFIAFGLDPLNHLPNPILTSDKLASIEMGTEVISGSGTTTITNYSIK